MKVGVYFGQTHPLAGGGYSFQLEIFEGLKKYGSNKHVFALISHENLVSRYMPSAKVKNRSVPKNQSYLLLEKAVKELGLDLVWFVSPAVFQKVSVPFFYTVWDLQHRLQPYFPEVSLSGWKWEDREATYQYVLPRASKILTGTHEGKNEIMHFYRVAEKNIEVVPFPTPTFSNEDIRIDLSARFGIKGRYLFYPAQFWPHKNHVNILHSLRLLIDTYNMHLEIVFTGSDKGNLYYVKEEIRELGLEEYIHFPGFVTRKELKALYQSAHALIFASFFGPDNLPPLEAFSLGCPVLAARVPGSEEQLGDSALFFDPTDINEMMGSIHKICTDDNVRKLLINKGRARAGKYHIKNYLERIYLMLDKFEPIRSCWKNDYKHM